MDKIELLRGATIIAGSNEHWMLLKLDELVEGYNEIMKDIKETMRRLQDIEDEGGR